MKDGRFKCSTGLSVESIYWDKVNQKAITKGIDKVKIQRNIFINSELSKFSLCLENAINQANLQEIPITKDYLTEKFNEEFRPEKKSVNKSTIGYAFDFFINELRTGKKLTKKGLRYSKGRIDRYLVFYKNIEKFLGSDFPVNKIDEKFINNYSHFRNQSGITLNSISYEIVMLKSFLKSTYKSGLHNNQIFENDDFKIYKEEVNYEFLTDNELERLYNFKYESEKLRRVCDLFIIEAYTGLRYSDLHLLNESNITKDGLFQVIQEKTDDFVYLPIHWRVFEIMDKYGGKPPQGYDKRNMNKYIKEMCEVAGINDKIHTKKTRGGVLIKKVQYKWELISTHTARRSFATNLHLQGVDLLTISKLLGHRKIETTLKYICVRAKEVAVKMKDHSYFKPKI